MLELPNFGHTNKSTVWFESRDKILLVTFCLFASPHPWAAPKMPILNKVKHIQATKLSFWDFSWGCMITVGTKHVVKASRPIVTPYCPYRAKRKTNKLIIIRMNKKLFRENPIPLSLSLIYTRGKIGKRNYSKVSSNNNIWYIHLVWWDVSTLIQKLLAVMK